MYICHTSLGFLAYYLRVTVSASPPPRLRNRSVANKRLCYILSSEFETFTLDLILKLKSQVSGFGLDTGTNAWLGVAALVCSVRPCGTVGLQTASWKGTENKSSTLYASRRLVANKCLKASVRLRAVKQNMLSDAIKV
eukprot:3758670-Pleurochrysis_carterae.AAC.2